MLILPGRAVSRRRKTDGRTRQKKRWNEIIQETDKKSVKLTKCEEEQSVKHFTNHSRSHSEGRCESKRRQREMPLTTGPEANAPG